MEILPAATIPLLEPPELLPPIKLHKDSIKVGQRMREDLGTLDEQNDLANSIKEFGLIHPLTVNEKRELIAGGRRYHVCTTILKWDELPVTLAKTEGSEARLRMMELEENIRRKEMTWKEKVRSIAEVHRLHKRDAALNGEKWTQTATGELLDISLGNVSYCIDMEAYLKDPNHPVQKAESLMEAFRILLELKQAEVEKVNSRFAQEIQKSNAAAAPGATLSIDSLLQGLKKTDEGDIATQTNNEGTSTGQAPSNQSQVVEGGAQPNAVQSAQLQRAQVQVELSKYFRLGNSIELMNKDEPESVDHIVTDIPYGIDMEMLSQSNESFIDVASVEQEHDVEGNVKLMKEFLPAAYRVLKPASFCVFWYDLDHHMLLQHLAEKVGFTVCRWPLHWIKTHRCKNQSAQYNFTKSVEHAMVLRKGNSTLVSPQLQNYWIGGNEDAVKEFGHPFAKPEGLWRWIYSAIAPKGSVIYDPFAGCFSGPIAAAKSGYYPRGSEIKEAHFNRGVSKFKDLMVRWFADKEVVFI